MGWNITNTGEPWLLKSEMKIYEIRTESDLLSVNSENKNNYKLMNDLKLSLDFKPITIFSNLNFNGNNKIIELGSHTHIFESKVTSKNVLLKNIQIKSDYNIEGIIKNLLTNDEILVKNCSSISK